MKKLILNLLILCGLFCILIFSQFANAAEPMSWTRFDGPQHNRVSQEMQLDLRWNGKTAESSLGSTNSKLFTIHEQFAESAPLVFNSKIYLATKHFTEENQSQPKSFRISCWKVDGQNKDLRFRYQLDDLDNLDNSVENSSNQQDHKAVTSPQKPLLVGDPVLRQLFCLTQQGNLYVIDSDLGHLLWKKSLADILGFQAHPDCIATPLIFEHCLIIPVSFSRTQTNKSTSFLLALDRRNGQVLWVRQQELAAKFQQMPAPISAVYQKQIVAVVQLQPGQIEMFQIRTGKPVAKWNLSQKNAIARELLNESEKLAVLSQLSNQEETWGIDLFALPAAKKNEQPESISVPALQPSSRYTMLLHADRLFSLSAAGLLQEYHLPTLKILAETNLSQPQLAQEKLKVEIADEKKKVIQHHLLFLDQKLLATSTAGLWCVLSQKEIGAKKNQSPKPLTIKFRQQREPVVALPVIARKKIYVLTTGAINVQGSIDESHAVSQLLEPLTILAKEKESTTAGGILITPAIQTLKPGWKQTLQVQLYSDQGYYLRTLRPEEIQWNKIIFGKIEAAKSTFFAPEIDSKTKHVNRDVRIEAKFQSFQSNAIMRIIH